MTITHTSPTGKYVASITVKETAAEALWWSPETPSQTFVTLYKLSEIDHRGNVAGWVRINKETNQ